MFNSLLSLNLIVLKEQSIMTNIESNFLFLSLSFSSILLLFFVEPITLLFIIIRVSVIYVYYRMKQTKIYIHKYA